jgi:hypothetical protein
MARINKVLVFDPSLNAAQMPFAGESRRRLMRETKETLVTDRLMFRQTGLIRCSVCVRRRPDRILLPRCVVAMPVYRGIASECARAIDEVRRPRLELSTDRQTAAQLMFRAERMS